MTPVKKVEIVADSLELPNIVRLLEEIGVSGYTVIRDVTGRGGRGARTGDDLTGVFKNSYIMTACSAEQAARIVEAIRPILERFGGVGLITDSQWVVH